MVISAVCKFPESKNIQKVQSFLGLTGYFSKFIPDYAIVSRPLSDLLCKDASFKFTTVQRDSFNALKLALTNGPVLNIYRQGAQTEVHTEASKFGFGAVLMQEDEHGMWHPTHYMSKKASVAEEKLHSYYLEMKTVYYALSKFRIYLLEEHSSK